MKKTVTRNTNMELLRVLSMGMVLVLHALLKSGALTYHSGPHYWTYWAMETLSICAVNIFVLISGYFQVNTTFKARNVIKTALLGAWLYSVVFSLAQWLISGGGDVSKEYLLKAFFPIVHNKFWFVNTYVVLYLVSPFLNKMLRNISDKALTGLVAVLVLIFSVRPTFLPVAWSQDTTGGTGIIWFVTLYCVAAWIRRIPANKIPSWLCLLVYLLTSAGMLLGKRLLLLVGRNWYAERLYLYASPLVLIQSIALLLTFLNARQLPQKLGRGISFFAKHSFSVYVIHFAMWNVLFTTVLKLDQRIESPVVGAAAVLGGCCATYLFCVCVDAVKTFVEGLAGKRLAGTWLGRKYAALLERWDRLFNDV